MKNTTKIIGFTAFMAVIVLCIAALSMVGCDTGSSPKIEEPGPVEPGPGPSPGPGPIIIGGGGGGGGAKAGSVTYTGDLGTVPYKLVITQNTGRYVAQVNDTYALTIGKTTTKGAVIRIETSDVLGKYKFFLQPNKTGESVITVEVEGDAILTFNGTVMTKNIGYSVRQEGGEDYVSDTTGIIFIFKQPISALTADDITIGDDDDIGEVVKGKLEKIELEGEENTWLLEIKEVKIPGFITISIKEGIGIDSTPLSLFVYSGTVSGKELSFLDVTYNEDATEFVAGKTINDIKAALELTVYAVYNDYDSFPVELDFLSFSVISGDLNVAGSATIQIDFLGLTYDIDITITADPILYITFDSNWPSVGVEGTGDPPAPKQVAMSGLMIDIPGQGDLVKEGYTFKGWNRRQDGSGATTYVEDDFFPVTATATLWAKWQKHTYTIEFEENNGQKAIDDADELDDYTGLNALEYFDKISPPDIYREGYTLDGWFTDDVTFEDEWIFASSYGGIIDGENITLYAKWSPNNVTIDVDVTPLVNVTLDYIVTDDNDNDAEVTGGISLSSGDSYTVTLTDTDDVSGIIWKIAGLDQILQAYVLEDVFRVGDDNFTLTGDSDWYTEGGHFLILTFTKGGTQYQQAIPFTVAP